MKVGLTAAKLIGAVPAVVLAVAPVVFRDALGVLAGELLLGAGPVVVLAVLPLVAAVAAVVVAVAHPHVGHALVVGALEVVLGTLLGRAVPLVLAAGAVHLVVAPLLQGDAKTTCE